MSSRALFGVGVVGNITAVMLFLSPTPTFWEILKRKTSVAYSGVPYVCSLANCLIWVFYGLPIVTSNNILIITINGFGVLMESIYLLIYIPYSQGKEKVKISILVLFVLIVFAIIVIITLVVFPHDKRSLFVGSIALILNTAMYASPLSVMKEVIQTKSVKSMPFLLSLCTLVNSCLWAAYGILKLDKFIIIPNGLGIIFGVMQIALYAYFYKGEKDSSYIESGHNCASNATTEKRRGSSNQA